MIQHHLLLKRRVRSSNALLILILTIIGLLYVSFIVEINSRFKRSEYSFVNNDKSYYVEERLAAGKVIKIADVGNCLLLSADSARIEISRDDRILFDIRLADDTITIRATNTLSGRTLIYVPTGTPIVAKGSQLELRSSFDVMNQPAYDIQLVSSDLVATAKDSHTFFSRLTISGNGQSTLRIEKNVHVGTLELEGISDVSLARGWQVNTFVNRAERGSQLTKIRDSVSVVSYQTNP